MCISGRGFASRGGVPHVLGELEEHSVFRQDSLSLEAALPRASPGQGWCWVLHGGARQALPPARRGFSAAGSSAGPACVGRISWEWEFVIWEGREAEGTSCRVLFSYMFLSNGVLHSAKDVWGLLPALQDLKKMHFADPVLFVH